VWTFVIPFYFGSGQAKSFGFGRIRIHNTDSTRPHDSVPDSLGHVTFGHSRSVMSSYGYGIRILSIIQHHYPCYEIMGTICISNVIYSVASPAIKKLRLRSQLRLQLCRYPVPVPVCIAFIFKSRVFFVFFERIPIQVTCFILFTMNYYLIYYFSLIRTRNFINRLQP
jgi:hypothetical protein